MDGTLPLPILQPRQDIIQQTRQRWETTQHLCDRGPILKPSRRGGFALSVQGSGRAPHSKVVTASVAEQQHAPRPGRTIHTGSKKAARSGDHEKAIETIRPVQWAHLDSNQGQPGYEPGALTAELWALQERAKQLAQIQ